MRDPAAEKIRSFVDEITHLADAAAELAAVVSRLTVEHEGRGIAIADLRSDLDAKNAEIARLRRALNGDFDA